MHIIGKGNAFRITKKGKAILSGSCKERGEQNLEAISERWCRVLSVGCAVKTTMHKNLYIATFEQF